MKLILAVVPFGPFIVRVIKSGSSLSVSSDLHIKVVGIVVVVGNVEVAFQYFTV